jgi:hypothetical protein
MGLMGQLSYRPISPIRPIGPIIYFSLASVTSA